MTKAKQNLVLFIEPPIDPWSSPSKIGNSYINRFAIDEEAAFEIIGIYNLSKMRVVGSIENYGFGERRGEDMVSDNEIIDSAIKKSAEYKTKRLNTHLIFAGVSFARFEPEIAYAMKIYKIRSISVTKLEYVRQHLITKEVMETISKGEYYNSEYIGGDMFTNKSVNDDLESLYKNIKFQSFRKACTNRYGHQYLVQSYFLPKLTKKELKLVEVKDKDYMMTFRNTSRDPENWYPMNQMWNDDNPDVAEAEMKLSKSKSKFALVECTRWTFIINMEDHTPTYFPKRRYDWTSRFGTDWKKWVPRMNL